MREAKINVLYYPDMLIAEATLKEAILLFDELHFMDRPSFTFGEGSFGSIVSKHSQAFGNVFW